MRWIVEYRSDISRANLIDEARQVFTYEYIIVSRKDDKIYLCMKLKKIYNCTSNKRWNTITKGLQSVKVYKTDNRLEEEMVSIGDLDTEYLGRSKIQGLDRQYLIEEERSRIKYQERIIKKNIEEKIIERRKFITSEMKEEYKQSVLRLEEEYKQRVEEENQLDRQQLDTSVSRFSLLVSQEFAGQLRDQIERQNQEKSISPPREIEEIFNK